MLFSKTKSVIRSNKPKIEPPTPQPKQSIDGLYPYTPKKRVISLSDSPLFRFQKKWISFFNEDIYVRDIVDNEEWLSPFPDVPRDELEKVLVLSLFWNKMVLGRLSHILGSLKRYPRWSKNTNKNFVNFVLSKFIEELIR